MKGECCERDGERKLFCICLEDYMEFCDNLLPRPDFIIDQLNHIIFMHGFIRMHRRHKAEIMRTLDAMELMQVTRSTLEESISLRAPLAVEEVSRDLRAIGWQECPVGSVQSVGLPRAAVEDDAATVSSPVTAICFPTPTSAAREKEAAKRLNRTKRKRGAQELFPLLTMGPANEAASC